MFNVVLNCGEDISLESWFNTGELRSVWVAFGDGGGSDNVALTGTSKSDDDDDDDVCPICLMEMSPWLSGATRLICCGKRMHIQCGKNLLKSNCKNRCPMCNHVQPGSHEKREIYRLTQTHAEKGKPWAMHMVGLFYSKGHGVPQSDRDARVWFEQAANLGNPDGHFDLGVQHLEGRGGPVSIELAKRSFENAAAQGHLKAHVNLAILHRDGGFGRVSKQQARLWFKKAAQLGYAVAQFNLGLMHVKGEGAPASKELAAFWWTCARKQEHMDAVKYLPILKSKCFSCDKSCDALGKKMMLCCSRCKCASYCSSECQKREWRAGHKAKCKAIVALTIEMRDGGDGDGDTEESKSTSAEGPAESKSGGVAAGAAKTKKNKNKKKKKKKKTG